MNYPTFEISHSQLLDDFININAWSLRYKFNVSVVFNQATTFDIEESELFLNQLDNRLDSIIFRDINADITIELDEVPNLIEIIDSDIKIDSISAVHVNIFNSDVSRGNPLDRPLIMAMNSINVEDSGIIECDIETVKFRAVESIIQDADISADEADSSAELINCEFSGTLNMDTLKVR